MSLDELLKAKTIRKTIPNKRLIKTAIAKAQKDLVVSKKLLNLREFDWAYTTSYTAMLVSARAYMNSQGYRTSSDEGHVAVIEFLKTEPDGSDIKKYILRLDGMRRARHRVTYDDYDIISESGAKGAFKMAQEFVSLIENMIPQI